MIPSKRGSEKWRTSTEDLQQMIRLREQKLKQALLSELNEEANLRKIVAADMINLSEAVKDLRAVLDDEVQKIDGRVAKMAMKLKVALSEVDNALQSERTMRERADLGVKHDIEHEVSELRTSIEVKGAEQDSQQNAQINRMCADIMLLNQSMEMTKEWTKHYSDEVEQRREKKNYEDMLEVRSQVCGIRDLVEGKFAEVTEQRNDLRSELLRESEHRARAFRDLENDIAEEHLQREQDESVVIDMLERCIRQVNEMSTHG